MSQKAHLAFVAAVRADARAALVTQLTGSDAGAQLLVSADGARVGRLGSEGLGSAAAAAAEELMWVERSEARQHDGERFFIDVTAPPPRLLVVGAIDLAEQLCGVARLAGWRPFVIDPRTRFASDERFPSAERVFSRWPQDAFEELAPLDRATAVVALSHDPKLDEAALGAALASEAFFVGAMGSRRAVAARRERLLDVGFTEAQIDRISSPVGLDIGAVSPGETAVSIMAEIFAARSGRAGGKLMASQGRIHA